MKTDLNLKSETFQGQDIDIVWSREDISSGANWKLNEDCHSIIVHLGGDMRTLETQTDDASGSYGPANPGEIWIIPAGTRYEGRAYGGIIEYAVISVSQAVLQSVADNNRCASPQSYHGIKDSIMVAFAKAMTAASSDQNHLNTMNREILGLDLIRHIFRQYSEDDFSKRPNRKRCNMGDRAARELRRFIDDQLEDPLSLDDLSRFAKLTPHQLLEAFRVVHKTTPLQYIIDQRVRRAQWLLLNTQEDITGIAYATGFSSHSHLTTTFKSRLGCTPSDFRTN